MSDFGLKVAVAVTKVVMAVMFVVVLVCCIPFAIVGDIMNEHHRRIKR